MSTCGGGALARARLRRFPQRAPGSGAASRRVEEALPRRASRRRRDAAPRLVLVVEHLLHDVLEAQRLALKIEVHVAHRERRVRVLAVVGIHGKTQELGDGARPPAFGHRELGVHVRALVGALFVGDEELHGCCRGRGRRCFDVEALKRCPA